LWRGWWEGIKISSTMLYKFENERKKKGRRERKKERER